MKIRLKFNSIEKEIEGRFLYEITREMKSSNRKYFLENIADILLKSADDLERCYFKKHN